MSCVAGVHGIAHAGNADDQATTAEVSAAHGGASLATDGYELVSIHEDDGDITEEYAFGEGSTLVVTRPASSHSSGGAGPLVSTGAGDRGAYIAFSRADQRALIAGGVGAVSGLAAALSGPFAALTTGMLGGLISPYLEEGLPCANRTDGRTTWQVWIEPKFSNPNDPGHVVRDYQVNGTNCIAP